MVPGFGYLCERESKIDENSHDKAIFLLPPLALFYFIFMTDTEHQQMKNSLFFAELEEHLDSHVMINHGGN